MKKIINTGRSEKIPAWLSWLFPYKLKKLPVSTNSRVAYYLFQNKLSLTLINWIFQGMLGMDRADLIGKLALEALVFILVVPFIEGTRGFQILTAFVTAHTVNWLINSHFWVFGRFLGITHTATSRFFPYVQKVVKRVRHNPSVPIVIIIGSISREENFKSTSDVDIMFIKDSGIGNSLHAVLVTFRERLIAFVSKFPLHLELYDNIETMKKHRSDEVPYILKDTHGEANKWYKKEGRKVLNFNDKKDR